MPRQSRQMLPAKLKFMRFNSIGSKPVKWKRQPLLNLDCGAAFMDSAMTGSQMIRVKIPFGGLTAAQLEMLADVAEEFSDNIIHITTRQDVQYHYVDINTTAELMRRLASVDITTKEACR